MVAENVIEGKNVEEAVKIASDTFNIPVEKLKYDVITYGSTGIFGLVGVKKAKIRVHITEEKQAIKETKKENDPPLDLPVKKGPEKKSYSKGKTKSATEKKVQVLEVKSEPREIAEKEIPPKVFPETEKEAPIEKLEKMPAVLPEELKEYADNPVGLGQAVLQRILEMITVEASVEVEQDEERILYNVIGGKAAVLIGKRGQTLEAIQYLIEKIVNRISEKRIRIQIDVQGYLKNRKENLEELAARLAEKATRIGKPVTVGEMNVHDRKIVHMALKDHRHVRTQSMGSGFYRKLMIFPKKNGPKNGTKRGNPSKESENNKELENNE